MGDVRAAERYRAPSDLCVAACYYNPTGFRSKRESARRFIKSLQDSGVPFEMVECTFNGSYDLPIAPNIRRVRARDIIWVKERLLNWVVGSLPAQFTKVAWVDADVLFENPDWAIEAASLLDHHVVVQPFHRAIRLPPSTERFEGIGIAHRGFAAMYAASEAYTAVTGFNRHGHTGFAWAARRNLLASFGLYEHMISGAADHVMAHAFAGHCRTECYKHIFFDDWPLLRHFFAWAGGVAREVRGRMAYVPGAVLHLWHGEMANRNYYNRMRELTMMAFDPTQHLVPSGPVFNWSEHAPREMRNWAAHYFDRRLEDTMEGAATNATGV